MQKLSAKAALAQKTADFSDESFLFNEDSFKEAEARRAKFVAAHLKLVKERSSTAKLYFSAKDTAAEKVRLEAEWNTKWLASVTAHEEAIAHHDKMTAAQAAALAAKIAATNAHLIATEATSAALAVKEKALAKWNLAKIAEATATQNNTTA